LHWVIVVRNNEINTLCLFKKIIASKADLVNQMPNDASLTEAFRTSKLSNKQARGVLYLLEKSIRNERQSTELKPISSYTLEHVMPKKWQNHWDNNLTSEERDKRTSAILSLGNLTIITGKLNSSIRDSDWKTKKDGRGKNKGLKDYSRGLETFDKYIDTPAWDEDMIRKRASELLNHAKLRVWKLAS